MFRTFRSFNRHCQNQGTNADPIEQTYYSVWACKSETLRLLESGVLLILAKVKWCMSKMCL